MLGKHPLELPPLRKFSKEELAEALRLSVIAELDAINLYLQFARYVEDERYRKVFEDIAKEEKTHVGEFLTLLKSLDPEQVAELAAGAEEVKALTGIEAKDPPGESNVKVEEGLTSKIADKVREYADKIRKFRHYIPVTYVGRGVENVLVEVVDTTGDVIKTKHLKYLPMHEISVEFNVKVRTLDYLSKAGLELELPTASNAAVKLALQEDSFVLEGKADLGIPGLLTCEGSLKTPVSDWSEPGSAVEEVAKAVKAMLNEGVAPPYVLFLSPGRYSKLLRYHERAGVLELGRVKALVSDVVQIPQLSDDVAVIVSTNKHYIDLVVAADTVVDYIGPEADEHKYRVWETLTLRVKNPKAINVLKT